MKKISVFPRVRTRAEKIEKTSRNNRWNTNKYTAIDMLCELLITLIISFRYYWAGLPIDWLMNDLQLPRPLTHMLCAPGCYLLSIIIWKSPHHMQSAGVPVQAGRTVNINNYERELYYYLTSILSCALLTSELFRIPTFT